MAKKKVLIAVGGTGGHVFPALTLARQLKARDKLLEILFVGGGLSKNRYFEKESFPYKDVSCGTLSLSKPLQTCRNVFRIMKGIWQSRRAIREYKPDVVVGFGSYHTFPALIAAKMAGSPLVLHEANRIPGKVNRLLSPYAAITGVHFSDTAKRLKGNVEEMPIPLRDGYRKGTTTKAKARSHYGLDPAKTTLLIFGGSQGAQALNRIVSEAVQALPAGKFQLLQFTGDPQTAKQLSDLYAKKGISACVKEFENRMDLAWQAADCVIARSGAGTLAEQLEFEVPGILIPYPHAADNHQESNADFMVDIAGGAIKRRESDLTAAKLASDLVALMNSAKLNEMQKAMQKYKTASKKRQLCDVVLEMM